MNINNRKPENLRQDMSLNLIIAARDTTACALSWMFWELARNPEIQAKLCVLA